MTKTIRVSDLEGAELDYWVAKASAANNLGSEPKIIGDRCYLCMGEIGHVYSPSTEWNYGGPIIEREYIGLRVLIGSGGKPPSWVSEWRARILIKDHLPYQSGPTPLIAAMRAYVASKFGDTIEVEDD